MNNDEIYQRKIVHIDMDCFYAAVEMRDFPHLKGKPLAVGGHSKQRGVISTCNYEARAFGVRSAMPTAKAMKLCPSLILVPGRMDVYKSVSGQIREIFSRYTEIIEPLSLDEAYLDVTACPLHSGSATRIAQEIRQTIKNELSLTASAGVAPIKFLAKVASDINKPDGIFVIPPHDVQQFIDQMPLEKIPGVGKVALERLHAKGLYTGLDVRESDYRILLKTFGRLGASLWKKCRGIDDREVVTERERKSVGVERTLATNIKTYEQCWQLIENVLFPELEARLAKVKGERGIRTQGIKLKFDDFQLTTIEHAQKVLDLNEFRWLLAEVLERQKSREIRLIGLHVQLQSLDSARQLTMF
jgi:DNA polymerase-4